MLKFRRTFLTAAFLLCAVAAAFAETSGTKTSADFPFIVDVWESGAGEQKLPQSSVIAITQTHDGYLWLGTLGGLVRFDGSGFTVFNKANTPGLDSNRIVYLFEDSHGNLWVGTETAGVILIQPDGEIKNLGIGRGNREQRLKFACEDSSGAVWLNTADGRVMRWRGTNYETLSGNVTAIMSEKNGPMWIGARMADASGRPVGQMLVALTAASNSPAFIEQAEVPVSKLDFLLASKNGGYWRLADGRVQKWRGTKMERDFGAYRWNAATPVSDACEDFHGNLIVGTQGEGVFWYDSNGRATQISTKQGLSANSRGIVLSLCVDREGNLWAGTDGGGLNRIKRRLFDVLGGSEDWTIQSVSEDEKNGMWIGTFGQGLKHLSGGAIRDLGASQGLENLYVRSVLASRDNKVFVGTFGYGLFQIEDNTFLQFTNSEIASPFISAVYQDRSGKLWFGTQNGLVSKDGASWKKFTTRDGLSADSVRAIADDGRGNIWIGTENGGLNCLSNGQFTAFHRMDGDSRETITALQFDRSGVLWIGTDGAGLERFENGKWFTYSKRDGLLSDSIGYLIEDAQNNLWMGSYAGLMRVPISALNDFAARKIDFIPCHSFGTSDGLPTSECTQGSQPAACLARDGRLWFPTKNGLVSVNPASLKQNTNHPPVIIESVLVEGVEQNTNEFGARVQAIRIPHGKERLEIHFTSLNFSTPENVRFRYQLEGHESHWVDAGNNRVATYTKLPPNEYHFRVVAFNEDGVMNPNGATLTVIVLPAFWQTLTFKIFASLVLIGIIGGTIYYFSTQKLQRELAIMKQHEALERERARIARDLHDQLGANLTQVALLGEMAEADKDLPDEVESHAQQICETARETTHALDEIVWAVNPSNDTLEGLVNYACKYAQEYFELAGVSHRFEVPAQLPATDIAPDVRHNVFLAFKESVNNVVKHAHATAARVRLVLNSGSFTIEVEDNGRGLPKSLDDKSGRNGLRNMRRRMEDVGGSFSIGPAAEQGTVVRLTAPLAK
jgi:ligand-binding sensor domain-containing protein/signal transduction histidine kinase